MNKRQLSLIETLKKGTHSLESLSAKYEVSQRTLRNDIAKINEWCMEQGIDFLNFKSGGVIEVPDSFKEHDGEASEQDL